MWRAWSWWWVVCELVVGAVESRKEEVGSRKEEGGRKREEGEWVVVAAVNGGADIG